LKHLIEEVGNSNFKKDEFVVRLIKDIERASFELKPKNFEAFGR